MHRQISLTMPISPCIVELRTAIKNELVLTTLASSITLPPGTIAADVRDDIICVHAITNKVAGGLISGEMEKRVSAIYQND